MFKKVIILVLAFAGILAGQDTWDYSIPNMAYLHRKTTLPLDIHVLIVDLKNPGVNVQTVLAMDRLWDRQVVSSMANRVGAKAAINGDFFGTHNGIPQGITVLEGEMHISPKFRTALGFTKNKTALVGMWTDRWNWYGSLSDEQGNTHDLVMLNIDYGEGWMILFTDKYGSYTPGRSASSNTTEVFLSADSVVQEIRVNEMGKGIPDGWIVVAGREESSDWLQSNIEVGEKISVNWTTIPDWHNLWYSVSGAPRIVKEGEYYADPIAAFPDGEDMELSYKNTYYNSRHPRTAAGVTINCDTLILAVCDGRQPGFSIGMTLWDLGHLLIEFGAWSGVQFDGGGSSTFFYNGAVRNSPSDGSQRAVANSLCVLSDQNYINIAPEAQIINISGEMAGYEGHYLIDGEKHRGSGKWVSTDSGPHWIELDLGKITPVTHFQLFHAFYAGDEDYLNSKEFKIYSKAGINDPWTEDFHIINDDFMPRDNLCSYETVNNTRYIKLEVIKAGHVDYENILRQPELEIFIADTTTSVERVGGVIPDDYMLEQNYPNPFNPSTKIRFHLSKSGHTRIVVYDLLGRKIALLADEYYKAGSYEMSFSTEEISHELSSGMYICKIKSGDFIAAKKMLFLK